ncbi:MAG: glycosyltransferase family 39 protein [Acidobacteria bacterium]|nr:glycosyltransferase family 39 protein [Acidobacteriota bacterium]
MTRARIAVTVVWLAFVVRGVYYCAQMPLWEGLDEWAHFAAVEWFAGHGRMPARTLLVSDAVVRTLELAPLPWSNNGWVAGAVNHDDFWRLPPEERARRRAELAHVTAWYRRPPELPPSIQRQYEGQQPPLYYAVMALPYRLTRGWPLERQVLLLRLLSVLLASAAIPLAWSMARRVAAARAAALAAAGFVAASPAVAIQMAHVGNDALAFPLMTLALWAVVRAKPRWVLGGAALGAALLAKGYALVLAAVFLLMALRDRRMWGALAIAAVLAGWWYGGTLASTGTLAGDQMAVASRSGAATKLAAIARVNWPRVADSAAMTHIWIGGWSFLQVRSWMYRVWEALALLAVVGLALLGRRADPRLVAAQVLFVLATCFFSLNAFVATGMSAGVGWYALSMAAVEAILLASGLTGLVGVRRGPIAMTRCVLLAVAFDLYTVLFVLAPYYGGLIRHRANGSLEAYHWSGLPPLPATWPLYLLANAALVWAASRAASPSGWSFRSPR